MVAEVTAAIPNPHDTSRYLPASYSTTYDQSGVAWTAPCEVCGADSTWTSTKTTQPTSDCPCADDMQELAA